MRKFFFGLCAAMGALLVRGSIIVSDVQVFSGYPWKEVVIGYTVKGTDSSADCIRLTAMDKSANKTYVVESGARTLTGAGLSEGWHLMRWNAASQGAKFSSANVEFTVSVIYMGGVQLWENGPYWAECNVGASKPEEYGYYFSWGDTVGYKRNASNTGWVSVENGASFSFYNGHCPTYGESKLGLWVQGYIDSTGNLVAKYDAATAHLGTPWRMPTDAEFSALISNCTMTWTRSWGGVYGWRVTGKGAYWSKSIFLPAAGCGTDSYPYFFGPGSCGYYWSSTPDSDDHTYYTDNTWCLFFNSGDFRLNSGGRYEGFTVRPLRAFAQ